MSKVVARWRLTLFRSGLIVVAIELGLYLGGVVFVQVIEPMGAKIRAGAWFFIVGTGLSLIVLTLSMFGSGWRRLGLAAMSLASLPFWYGMTLY
jgi:hypothetical protein